MAKYKIIFSPEDCLGCGTCTAICPDNWEFDEEAGKSKPKQTELEDLGCNKEAEDSCPMGAIKIEKVEN